MLLLYSNSSNPKYNTCILNKDILLKFYKKIRANTRSTKMSKYEQQRGKKNSATCISHTTPRHASVVVSILTFFFGLGNRSNRVVVSIYYNVNMSAHGKHKAELAECRKTCRVKKKENRSWIVRFYQQVVKWCQGKAMGFMGILMRIFKVQIKQSKRKKKENKTEKLRFCARIR